MMDELKTRAEITQLIAAWGFCRDQGRWDELADAFHEDGTIAISWLNGPYSRFVEASRMAAKKSSLQVKHHLGVPIVEVGRRRAISEVDVTIMVRAELEGRCLDVTSYARFLDRLEPDGRPWKIRARTAVYERDRADALFPGQLPADFLVAPQGCPVELRCLGGLFSKLGLPLAENIVTDGSPAHEDLVRAQAEWLSGV